MKKNMAEEFCPPTPGDGSTVTVVTQGTNMTRTLNIVKTITVAPPKPTRKELINDLIETLKLELELTDEPEERAELMQRLKNALSTKRDLLGEDWAALRESESDPKVSRTA